MAFPRLNSLRDQVLSGSYGYFWDTPDGNAPAGGNTPPAAVAPPASTTPASTTPPVAAAPPATSTGYTYQEDRSKWIPPHRLNEESTKRQSIEQELAQAKAQVAALAGVSPKDPAAMKSEEVKAAFQQLFPHLSPLLTMTKEQIEALVRTPEAAQRTTQMESRQWKRHADQQMATVYSDVAEAMNIEKLDADQQKDLREAFSVWLRGKAQSELQASQGADSATLTRYEEGDATLMKEFTTAYTKRWVEPARRTATANTAQRTRPTPNSQGRTQVTSVERPAKFNSLDERLDYAAKVAKERGVQFGGA